MNKHTGAYLFLAAAVISPLIVLLNSHSQFQYLLVGVQLAFIFTGAMIHGRRNEEAPKKEDEK
jgi:hypothetical protein